MRTIKNALDADEVRARLRERAEALGTAARQDANANDDGSGEEVRKDKVQTQGAGEKHRQQYFGNVSFTPGFSLSLLGEPLAGFWALWGG